MKTREIITFLDQRADYWLIVMFYAYLFGILVVEVTLRAFSDSIIWAVETAIYAFIWMTYISTAQLARRRQHLGFTLIRDSLNRTGQLVCLAIADFCMIAVASVIIYYMWQPVVDSIKFDQTFNAADVPIWIALIAVPLGWVLVVTRVVQRFIKLIQDYKSGSPLVPKGAFSMGE